MNAVGFVVLTDRIAEVVDAASRIPEFFETVLHRVPGVGHVGASIGIRLSRGGIVERQPCASLMGERADGTIVLVACLDGGNRAEDGHRLQLFADLSRWTTIPSGSSGTYSKRAYS